MLGEYGTETARGNTASIKVLKASSCRLESGEPVGGHCEADRRGGQIGGEKDPVRMLHIGDDWACEVVDAVNAGVQAV